jgi:hypothetical protein
MTWDEWLGEQLALADRQQLTDEQLFGRESRLSLLNLDLRSTPIVSNDHLDADGNPEIERYRVTPTGRFLLSCVSGRYPRSL